MAAIDSTLDLPARINRHKAKLRFGTHRIKNLQEIWNTQGGSAIRFRILDRLEHDDKTTDAQKELKDLADLWQEKFTGQSYRIIRFKKCQPIFPAKGT